MESLRPDCHRSQGLLTLACRMGHVAAVGDTVGAAAFFALLQNSAAGRHSWKIRWKTREGLAVAIPQ